MPPFLFFSPLSTPPLPSPPLSSPLLSSPLLIFFFQRVQLFNSFAASAMCRAGFLVLDVYLLSSSYPGGTLDGVHYKESVFYPAIDVLERYFQT